MRAIVQRVSAAQVIVEGQVVGECGPGLALLVGAKKGDDAITAKKLADRIIGLRIFNDADGKINVSLTDACPGDVNNILAISNFTVYGDTAKNRRPSFFDAAGYEDGEQLFNVFCDELVRLGGRVGKGVFGADMQVEINNDGPVTVIVET